MMWIKTAQGWQRLWHIAEPEAPPPYPNARADSDAEVRAWQASELATLKRLRAMSEGGS